MTRVWSCHLLNRSGNTPPVEETGNRVFLSTYTGNLFLGYCVGTLLGVWDNNPFLWVGPGAHTRFETYTIFEVVVVDGGVGCCVRTV